MSQNNNLLLYAGLGIGVLLLLKKRSAAITPGVQAAPMVAMPIQKSNVATGLFNAVQALAPTAIKLLTAPPDVSGQPVDNSQIVDNPVVVDTTASGVYETQPVAEFTPQEIMFQSGDYPGATMAGMGCEKAAQLGLY